jgi:hypothetical protein
MNRHRLLLKISIAVLPLKVAELRGAAVTLLGLIGALARAECFEDRQIQRFGSNLVWFIWGLVAAT